MIKIPNSKRNISVLIDKIENIGILFEDNHLLVVIKPPNMAISSSNDKVNDKDNLVDLLKQYLVRKYNKVSGRSFLGTKLTQFVLLAYCSKK
jgi:23S rRNA-/tRNA-specific pseudouridylate synthase